MTTRWRRYMLTCCACGRAGSLLVHERDGTISYAVEAFQETRVDPVAIERTRLVCSACGSPAVACDFDSGSSETAGCGHPEGSCCLLASDAAPAEEVIDRCAECFRRHRCLP